MEAMLPILQSSMEIHPLSMIFPRALRRRLPRKGDYREGSGAKTNEIYFTAGGTESDNWALVATAEATGQRETTLLLQRLSITPFSTPVSTWKSAALR